VASVGGYFYSTGSDVLAIHLYGGNTARVTVGDLAVSVRQESDFPWTGAVRITLAPERSATFALKLRIPGWARSPACSVNGKGVEVADLDRGYLQIRREWTAGDVISLDLPMPVERVHAHPFVKADVGRVALKRGPLVYCLEQVDNGNVPLPLIRLPRGAACGAAERPDLFDGIVTIVADAKAANADSWNGALYAIEPSDMEPITITGVPYFLWSNRGPNPMAVWLPES
jgi:DUF1680 family protein